MLPNRLRIYRMMADRVIPDRLFGDSEAEATLGEWNRILPNCLGDSRARSEDHLLSPEATASGDRWHGRRYAALKQIFLDGMGWTARKGELDTVRLIETINSRVLFSCGTIDDCFLLPRETLKPIARELGYSSVKELERAARSTAPSKVLSQVNEIPVDHILHQYDLGQLQAALFNCRAAEVELRSDYKHFVRAARLSGFELKVTDLPVGHHFMIGETTHFSGPKGYGCGLSKLANTLVNLSDWKLSAEFHDHSFRGSLQVTSTDGYVSAKPKAKAFDNAVEEKFWNRWHQEDRSGWKLIREPRLHHAGDITFCPDFEAERYGKRVTVEIVGKNDPSYYVPKLESLRKLLPSGSILLVKKQMADYFSSIPAEIVPYSNLPDPSSVLEALERLAPTGP